MAFCCAPPRLTSTQRLPTDTASDELGAIREGGWGWGTMFLDYDNDGDLDVAATNGYPTPNDWGSGTYPDDQDIFLLNHGDGTFGSVGNCVGVTDTRQGRGTCTAAGVVQ